jgi:hypothetical protein
MDHSTQNPVGSLTYDDLIDLHYMLEVDELFRQLMAAEAESGEAA